MTIMNISQHWNLLQAKLFPMIEEEFGFTTDKQQELIRIIDFARVEECIRDYHGCVGRPQKDRIAIAHAFLAKSVYNLPTTRCLIDRLLCDSVLRRLCGFESRRQVPSEATFSRSFAEFCASGLSCHLQDAFIKKYHASRLIGHISRDATAILAREKVITKPKTDRDLEIIKKTKGRPKKGEMRLPPEPKGLEKQVTLTLQEQLANLPRSCDIGVKKNSKGFKESWKGYKLHIDTADGDIPISAILTSASLHDSQVALPLSQITANKVTNLYDVMDAAYDAEIIRQSSRDLGHVPLIDHNKRNKESAIPFASHELERYKVRSSAERVNSNLKDNFGGCCIRVRGNTKVFGHLMFGLLSITISQTLRLVT